MSGSLHCACMAIEELLLQHQMMTMHMRAHG
jgi:hypothetical protein